MLTVLAAVAALAADPSLPPRFDLVCRGTQVVVSHSGRSKGAFAERYAVNLPRRTFVRASTRRTGRLTSSGSTDIVFTDDSPGPADQGAYEMYENLAHKLFSQRRTPDRTSTVTADCTVVAPAPGRRR